ncbi:MAG: GAF domain-containing sensor histidine kinase [Chloroflexota bacterium]
MGSRLFVPRRHVAYEVELRLRFLNVILTVFAILCGVYLLQGWVGLFQSRLFPWDGLGLLLLTVLCYLYSRPGTGARVSLSASWFVAGINILAAFEGQFYGIQHPINAIYLLGIMLAGLLIGGWFLGMWTIGGGLFVLMWGILEVSGSNDVVANPLSSWQALFQTVLFWWVLFGLTGWLVSLFAYRLEALLRLSRAQTNALTKTVGALNQQRELDAFMHQALKTIAERLAIDYGTLFIYSEPDGTVAPQLVYQRGQVQSIAAVSAEVPSPTEAAILPVWLHLLDTKSALFIDNPAQDPRIINKALLEQQGISTILYLPLLIGERLTGFFGLNSLEKRRFSQEEIDLAVTLTQLVTLAMQLAQLAEQQENAAVDAERSRMSRELHDTLAQGLTGILIQLEAAEDALQFEPEAVAPHLNRARELASSGLGEARRSVYGLRPEILEQRGLPTALEHELRKMTANGHPIGTYRVLGTPFPLPPELTSELLRIGQEGITNAVRHSKTREIEVELRYAENKVTLKVSDRGQGFDPAANGAGFGLTSMRERAAEIGGNLQIESGPTRGTTILCEVEI